MTGEVPASRYQGQPHVLGNVKIIRDNCSSCTPLRRPHWSDWAVRGRNVQVFVYTSRAEQSKSSSSLPAIQNTCDIHDFWNKIILKTANIHQILPVLLGTTVQLSPKLYFTEARLMIDCCDYWKLGHLQWRKLNDQIQTPRDRQVDQLYRTGLHDPPREWQGLHHHHWSHSIQQDFATAGKPQEYYWNIFKHFFFLL